MRKLILAIALSLSLTACGNMPKLSDEEAAALMIIGGQLMMNATRPAPAPTYAPPVLQAPSQSNCYVWQNGHIACSHR